MASCCKIGIRFWLHGMGGKKRKRKSALAKASTARKAKALRQPNRSEIKVPIGIPKMVAATIPKETIEIAFPAFSGPVICTAVSLASDQKTGSISAGMKRAKTITQMLEAPAATRLESAKSKRVKIKSFLRS